MNDLLQAAISAPNIIPTALLVFVLVYWLVVILGAIDIDFFDVDVETEADVRRRVFGNLAQPCVGVFQPGPGSLHGFHHISDHPCMGDFGHGQLLPGQRIIRLVALAADP